MRAGPYEFGIERKDIAAELRKFADDVENGVILLQTVVQQTRRATDDFEIKSLVIKYVEAKA